MPARLHLPHAWRCSWRREGTSEVIRRLRTTWNERWFSARTTSTLNHLQAHWEISLESQVYSWMENHLFRTDKDLDVSLSIAKRKAKESSSEIPRLPQDMVPGMFSFIPGQRPYTYRYVHMLSYIVFSTLILPLATFWVSFFPMTIIPYRGFPFFFA